jgi:hypothetical protein
LTQASPARAQAAYGSYVGLGAGFGLTSDANGDGADVSMVVAGRYKFLKIPMSVRGQLFLFGGSTAFVPTVSYDIPLNFQTDLYIGAGVSFAGGGKPSPVGDQTAFVIQPGVDYAFPNSPVMVFGNAVIAINGYREGGTAAAIQGGVGYRF